MKKRKLKFSAQDEKQRNMLQISKWNKLLVNTKFIYGMELEHSFDYSRNYENCKLTKF